MQTPIHNKNSDQRTVEKMFEPCVKKRRLYGLWLLVTSASRASGGCGESAGPAGHDVSNHCVYW